MELVLNVEEYTLYEKGSLETISLRIVKELVRTLNESDVGDGNDDLYRWVIRWSERDFDENAIRVNSENYDVEKGELYPEPRGWKAVEKVKIYNIPHFYPDSEKALYPQLQHYIKEVMEKAINNALKHLNATVKINLIHKLKNFVDLDSSYVYRSGSDEDEPPMGCGRRDDRLSSRTLSLKMVDARNELRKKLMEKLRNGNGGKPSKNVLSIHARTKMTFSWRFNVDDIWCVELTDTTIGNNLMYYYRDIEEPDEHFEKVVLWNGGTFYCDTTYSFRFHTNDEEEEQRDDVVFYFLDEESSIGCAILWCDETNEQGISDKIYLLYNPTNKIHTLKYEDDTCSAIHTELMFIDEGYGSKVIECYERVDGYNASPEENEVSSFELDKCKIELMEYMD